MQAEEVTVRAWKCKTHSFISSNSVQKCTTGSSVMKHEATSAFRFYFLEFLRDKRRTFHFNMNVMCGYSPPAEKKKALVQERVGVTMSPAPLQLNSQATQVAIFSPAAGRSVANSCPHLSDIQPSDDWRVNRTMCCSVGHRCCKYFLISIRSFWTGWINSADADLQNGQQWNLSPHSVTLPVRSLEEPLLLLFLLPCVRKLWSLRLRSKMPKGSLFL